MKRTDVIIIGGGQAGLAMSRCLTRRGVDHAILERGRVANSWRTERWDSLRLLTPNWQSRLPGWSYQGDDPNGFMTMPEVIAYLADYAESFRAPVFEQTTVLRVYRAGVGYRVLTDQDLWEARAVVIATGHCGTPFIPEIANKLYGDIHQVVPTRYRNPNSLPDGGVLVVGASASGLQLADELQRSGRDVTLAVGRHTRLPRSYRGRDIMWWLDRTGALDQRTDEVANLEASRATPSLQLVGRPDHSTLDLTVLAHQGVRLVGRAVQAAGTRVSFDGSLGATTSSADAKLDRVLDRIDAFIDRRQLGDRLSGPARPPRFRATAPAWEFDLRAEGIRTVVWATGFRPNYPWLDVPVLDATGELDHDQGITSAPGLYALGLQFMRQRKSSYIDGVRKDAEELAAHLHSNLCLDIAA